MSRSDRHATMSWISIFVLSLSLTGQAEEVPKDFNQDVSSWEIIPHPPKVGRWVDAYEAFVSGANYSQLEWTVEPAAKGVRARLDVGSREIKETDSPNFSMKIAVEGLEPSEPQPVKKVSDGWLAGYNKGEFGGALWWFSKDGKSRYQISDHQINQFIEHNGHLFAVEGMAHLGLTRGSMIELIKGTARWTASTFVELPGSGEAIASIPDGRLCIVTTNMLLAVSLDKKMEILLLNTEWGGLYPNSIAVDSATNTIYIGMRKFVVRYEIGKADHSFEFLFPDRSLLGKRFK